MASLLESVLLKTFFSYVEVTSEAEKVEMESSH